MPLRENITLRKLGFADKGEAISALQLLNRTQGNGLFGPDYLEKRLDDPEKLVLAAFLDQTLVGISVVEIIREFDYYLPFEPAIAEELSRQLVGAFTTLSVLESFQGKGIGQLLSQRRVEWLVEKKCNVAVGVSWVSGLAHTSNRTFERAGFRAVKRLNDFYRLSSLEKPFDCPGCHKIPCTCAAIFYRKDFNFS